MTTIRVTLQRHSIGKPVLYLSSPVLRSLSLAPGQTLSLRVGQRSALVTVLRHRAAASIAAVGAPVWNELLIPHGGPIHLRVSDNTLCLGPVVGILTTGRTRWPQQPFGLRSAFFRHLLAVAPEMGCFYYVFTPLDIDWENRRVRASSWRGGQWHTGWAPFPDVVYDRVPNRTAEALKTVQQAKHGLHALAIPIFNPGFFHKWEIHQRLLRFADIRPLLPETIFVPTAADIARLLRAHSCVYLKPAGGSLGLGIYQLLRHPRMGLLVRFRRGEKNVLYRFSGIAEALRRLGLIPRLPRYIAQQGINLITYQGRPVDFRVHAHKTRTDQWMVVAIGAKMAGPGCITTHLRTGGTLLEAEKALRATFGEQAKRILTRIEQTALRLAQALEASFATPVGELGFDLGVDRTGGVWMFEANAKPGRSVFHHSSMREADRLSRKAILDYALFLARFV
ncbi:MAG TPA: YheC/YheD family protein [Calditerricola sp.]